MSNSTGVKIIKRLTFADEIECSEENTRHWRHPWCHDQNNDELALVPPVLPKGEEGTIPRLFELAVESYGKLKCMGTRSVTEATLDGKKKFWQRGPYQWQTYSDVGAHITNAAKGILSLDTVSQKRIAGETCVMGLLAETSAEWQMAAQAALKCGIIITTVYTTLGTEAMLHGLNETEAAVLAIDWDLYCTPKMKDVISKASNLKHIILIGKCWVPLTQVGEGDTTNTQVAPFPESSELPKMNESGACQFTTLDALVQTGMGASEPEWAKVLPKSDDTAIIMYTSGSTGTPKGVVLTHKNFVSTIASIIAQGVILPTATDTFIGYLPLAHIFELIVENTCLAQGAHIAYAHARCLTASSPYMHKDNKDNFDLVAAQPTMFAGVPAILDLIKNGLSKKTADLPGLKGQLVRGSIEKVLGEPVTQGCCAKCLLGCASGKVLKKLKKQMGLNSLRLIVAGGAPLSPETQEYITKVLAPVAQGYGCTETCACASIQEVLPAGGREADGSFGGVGSIQPASEIKLLSVPDMNYLVTDESKPGICVPRGEILISGSNVSQTGYFKREAESAESFPRHEQDGKIWFHTGDVGVITSIGTLKIVDRKKDLVKLTGGEYVSLGKVEAGLKQVPGIGACVVFAQPTRDHCVCIVSQPEKGWESVGGKPDEKVLEEAIKNTLKKNGFATFEIPTKVKVDDAVWTPEGGLVTAAFKLQRNPLREHYNAPGGLLQQLEYMF